MTNTLLKVAYAILDKKGRIVVDDEDGLLVFKTKGEAKNAVIPEDEEIVKKVSIYAA